MPIAEYLPAPISFYCCNVMKKQPFAKYNRATKSYPYIGTMADESRIRKQAWIRQGCNAFTGKIHSQPLSFWTEQDILAYIKYYGLEITPIYGEIEAYDKKGNLVECDGYVPDGCKLRCSGVSRSGCIYCMYSLHSEKGETRFQKLAKTHPRQYEYCIGGGQWVDNPTYDPTLSSEPDEIGWIPYNMKKIWIPSKEGLGLGNLMRMANEIMGQQLWRWE